MSEARNRELEAELLALPAQLAAECERLYESLLVERPFAYVVDDPRPGYAHPPNTCITPSDLKRFYAVSGVVALVELRGGEFLVTPIRRLPGVGISLRKVEG